MWRFSDVALSWMVMALLAGLVQLPGGSVARTALGLAIVLFVPGYLLLALLYPLPGEVQRLQRFALSLPVSVALIVLMGLVLSRTPWGLTLTSFVAGIVAFAGVCGLLVVGRRRYLQPSGVSLVPGGFVQLVQTLRREPVKVWALFGAAASAVVAGALITWLLVPVADQPLTEFYMLDAEGGTAAFPTIVQGQEPVRVNLVVINREGSPLAYEIEARYVGRVLQTLGSGLLQDGEQWRRLAEVTIPLALQDPQGSSKLEFMLYKGEIRIPAGTVHLWISAAKVEQRGT
ncbi:MAG: DUF1616 domain-containing protein [Chloroflexi bacterium]|nr:DUF1616 domain-containing protein [Chloroflexota bacterium]